MMPIIPGRIVIIKFQMRGITKAYAVTEKSRGCFPAMYRLTNGAGDKQYIMTLIPGSGTGVTMESIQTGARARAEVTDVSAVK